MTVEIVIARCEEDSMVLTRWRKSEEMRVILEKRIVELEGRGRRR